MKSTHASVRGETPVRPGQSPHRPGHRTGRSGQLSSISTSGSSATSRMLTFSLASVVLGIAPPGEIAAEPHRDRACGDLGQACSDDDAGGAHRAGKPRGQGEGNSQAVGHPDDDVPDDFAPGKVSLAVGCLGQMPTSSIMGPYRSVPVPSLIGDCSSVQRSHGKLKIRVHTIPPRYPGGQPMDNMPCRSRTSAHPIPASQPGLHHLGQQDVTSQR